MRGTHPERALEQAVERDGALRRGEHVLIACSGGADSAGLAALLAALAKPLDLRLTIGHVNHGRRPSAWQDEAVALRIGAALGLRVIVRGLTIEGSGENAMRDARYEALAAAARTCGATAIATAHTAEDQTETVLLALFRGTGSRGLAGMPARRELEPGIDLVRPLLRRSRADVTSYVQFAALPYAVDPTNADLTYRRNAVREALTALRPLFPSLDEAVSRAAFLLQEEADGGPQAARRERVRQTLHTHGALEGVDFEHVAAAVRALERGRSGRFHMSPGVELSVENGELTVHREVR
ncbi:MAG TPA: tRNA lysidine(34) synthetase TilS [Candidatus Baltobacteraceae bacterium]|nr:tRNA lysidine(34) synthetase TilS [Candidatus Baltobacteraceae bacterium]